MAGLNYYSQREIERMQPRGFAEYMSNYGEHFSKKMCEWAVSRMKDSNGKKLEPWGVEKVDEILKKYGIEINNSKGYDRVYVANMCRADFYEKSVPDESHLAQYIKDLLDDPDGYEGLVFNRFMIDCMGMGIPIIWEDLL